MKIKTFKPIKVGDTVYTLHLKPESCITPRYWENIEHVVEFVVVEIDGTLLKVYNKFDESIGSKDLAGVYTTRQAANDEWIIHLKHRMDLLDDYTKAVNKQIKELEDDQR